MARRKTGEKQGTGKKDRAAGEEENAHHVQADDHSIAFEELHIGGDVRGDIRIGHTIGYTAEQVSVLLKQITTTLQPKPFDGRCPYKGLEVFEEEDAELFFGRDRLVNELVGRVKESRTVFITGPSGSGKSSLVRAGLIHALKDGAIKSSDRWLYETMKPGREPLKDLALALSRLKSPELEDYFLKHASETDILNKCAESVLSGRKDQRFLLFVDQFEEVFTQVNQEEERVAFINMLAHAGTIENGRVIVLFAMRSDFVSNCATYPALNELLSQEFRQIGAMQPDELVSAIALPAMHVGLPVENELIAQIINDMKGEPDALPLMQFALKDLFDAKQAEGGVIALTLQDYLKHGGIHKSLERHADATFAKLSESEQELTRSIFSGLIEIGRGTQDTKRTALFDELVPVNRRPEEVGVIVQKLADARLIITDEQAGKDTVTISHEKLIEAWPWLKKLVNENRDVIALQNEIASDAKEWQDHKRDTSYLYTGARLANAREQLEAKKLALSGLAQEFIEVGFKAYAEELEAARQRAVQLRNRSVYLSVALGIALIAVGVAIFFSIQSQQREKIARAGELAAQSFEMRENDLQLSSLLGIEAFRLMDTARARGALLDATNTNPQVLGYFIAHTEGVSSVAFSPNGKTLASASDDKTIILWDVQTYQPIGKPLTGHTGPIHNLAFSPNGKTLASAGDDKTIILWDVQTYQPIGKPLTGHTDAVLSIAFSPNGKMLASGSRDRTIILWDAETHQPIDQPLTGHSDSVLTIAFDSNGSIFASGSGHDVFGFVSGDNTIILWDVKTRKPIGQPLVGHIDSVLSIAFNPEGNILASGSSDNTIILWDAETHQSIGQPLIGHTDAVRSVAFSPDGKTLASSSGDGGVILWNTEARQPIGQSLTAQTGSIESVAYSPNGKILAFSKDDAIILWDAETHKSIGQPLIGHRNAVRSVAFSPDGLTLASGSGDTTIILWDVKTQAAICEPLSGHTHWVSSVAFSRDGKTLASSSLDGTIIFWDVSTCRRIGEPLIGQTGEISSIAFSPDGKTLASSDYDGVIVLWDIITRKPRGEPLTDKTDLDKSDLHRLAFSPDGNILALTGCASSGNGACYAGKITLWNLETLPPNSQRLIGHRNPISSVAFSPDGQTLASGSIGDDTIILWDMETRQPIGQPLTGHTSSVMSIAFSPDGQTLASGSNWTIFSFGSGDRSIILWDLDPEHWVQQSCQRVGRNLTSVEWDRYFPNETYRKTCDQWPLEPPVIIATPAAQCPFVYTEDSVTGEWEFDTTILYKIVDHEAAQMRLLTQFNGRLLIREEEPEISYLNRLYVLAKMADGSTRILEPDVDALKQTDSDYVTLHPGDEILISLKDYPVTGEVSQWWVMAVGYYSPLR